jgi:LmbE family N-acetylglucosaminyl deacetylase
MKQLLSLTAALLLAVPAHASLLATLPLVDSNAAQARSQVQPEERGIVALDQILRELANPFSVMAVAAHADDVDWATLAFVHRRLGARAIVVLASRSETAVEGWDRIRDTSHVLAASRAIGADVYFLNYPDASNARSAEDVLRVWGGFDQALAALVEALRLLRPDVVITSHNASAYPAEHQAVWRLTLEAFEASADVKRLPEAASTAWQVRRVFQTIAQEIADVAVDVAQTDETRAVSYQQMAAAAFPRVTEGSFATAAPKRFYKLVRSATGERMKPGASLLDQMTLAENVERSLRPIQPGGLNASGVIDQRPALVDALVERLVENRAEGSIDELVTRHGAAFFRVLRLRELLERAIGLAHGLNFRIDVSDRALVPGQKVSGRLVLANAGSNALPVIFHAPNALTGLGSPPVSSPSAQPVIVQPHSEITQQFQFELPSSAALTSAIPPTSARKYYALGSALPYAQSITPSGNDMIAYADVGVGEASVLLATVVRYEVVPPVELSITPPFAWLRDWEQPREREFIARVRNRTPGPLAGALWVVPLAISLEEYEPAHLAFEREDEEIEVKLKLRLPILKPPLAPDILLEFRRERPAPPDPLASSRIEVSTMEIVATPGVRIGVIGEQDGRLSAALSQLGVASTRIESRGLRAVEHGGPQARTISACSDLRGFDSIIIDRLALESDPDIALSAGCLLDYVRNGGNLILLSQNEDEWNRRAVGSQLAPAPLKLSQGSSNDPLNVLDAGNALLTKPNRIAPADLENWNAHSSPVGWPADYVSLIEQAGPGDSQKRSAMLIARVGKGNWVYASLNLPGQLERRNPVAFRLLANLLSARTAGSPQWHQERFGLSIR